MKKLLLTMLIGAGCLIPVSAKQLAIQYEGELVPNGATIDFKGGEVLHAADMDDPLIQEYFPNAIKIVVDPELYLVSDVEEPITIETQGDHPYQLCAGGSCENGTRITKQVENLKANVPLNLQLEMEELSYEGDPIEIPLTNIVINIYYNNDKSNVYTVKLKMGGISSGVEGIEADNAVVKFNGKALEYVVDGASQINVYSLSGKTVISRNVSGSGAISLEGLSKGVYLYRVSGKTNKASKIIIR